MAFGESKLCAVTLSAIKPVYKLLLAWSQYLLYGQERQQEWTAYMRRFPWRKTWPSVNDNRHTLRDALKANLYIFNLLPKEMKELNYLDFLGKGVSEL